MEGSGGREWGVREEEEEEEIDDREDPHFPPSPDHLAGMRWLGGGGGEGAVFFFLFFLRFASPFLSSLIWGVRCPLYDGWSVTDVMFVSHGICCICFLCA